MKLFRIDQMALVGCMVVVMAPACPAQQWTVLTEPHAPRDTAPASGPISLAPSPDGSLYVGYGALYRRSENETSAQIRLRSPQGVWSVVSVAGRALGAVTRPAGLAVDAQGVLLVSDEGNWRVATRAPDAGWTVLAPQGHGAQEVLGPTAIRFDSQGGLWVADYGRLHHRTPQGDWSVEGRLASLGGFGQGDAWQLPGGMAPLPDGGLLLCEVESVDANGINGLHYRNPLGQWALLDRETEATGIVADSAGNVFTAEPRRNRVRKRDLLGNWTVVAGQGELPGQVLEPQDVALDGQGRLLIADGGNARVQRYDPLAPQTPIPGDVDGDGAVTLFDVQTLLRLTAAITEPGPETLIVGDMNHDGKLNIQDAVLLLRRVAGL